MNTPFASKVIPNIAVPLQGYKIDQIQQIKLTDFMQFSPMFIAVFMLMNSLFSGDVKALLWLLFIIVGIVIVIGLAQTRLFKGDNSACQSVVPLLYSFPNLSLSTFIIAFTMMYLIFPMQQNNDWNYYAIVGFLGILAMDTIVQFKVKCAQKVGIFAGFVIGSIYSFVCYRIMISAGGDKLLYFNTVSSNNVYCSKPKKQQFKCYVYKNGEIISSV
jgi:surface polysaccharide O-acyltransferase-like enzyme